MIYRPTLLRVGFSFLLKIVIFVNIVLFNQNKCDMKRKLIILAVVIAVIVGLLAYYQYVPFWASIVSTGAFLAGVVVGWVAKWSNEHVVRK